MWSWVGLANSPLSLSLKQTFHALNSEKKLSYVNVKPVSLVQGGPQPWELTKFCACLSLKLIYKYKRQPNRRFNKKSHFLHEGKKRLTSWVGNMKGLKVIFYHHPYSKFGNFTILQIAFLLNSYPGKTWQNVHFKNNSIIKNLTTKINFSGHPPSVAWISIAFMSPLPRADLTTAGFSFCSSGIMISPNLAECSASFSSSKTYKNTAVSSI